MFENNIEFLKHAVENRDFILPVSEHHLPDGSMNRSLNESVWEDAMRPFEKIDLWDDHSAYFVLIPSELKETKMPTIVIAHGGGFNWRTGCEAGNIAWYFHQKGFNTAILSYRLAPYSRMDSLKDMQKTIRMIRCRKKELNVSERIAVMGFSAGGMLCGNCATLYKLDDLSACNEEEKVSARPDAAVIGYGALSSVSFPRPFLAKEYSEEEKVLFGRDEQERFFFAPEKHVTPDTPPMFIWQTISDDGRFSMTLAKALEEASVPYELHIFGSGSHGTALADGENDISETDMHVGHWADLCTEWLKEVLL